jgi:hypothetical protein
MGLTNGGSIHGKCKISSVQNVCNGSVVRPSCYLVGIGEERPKLEAGHVLPVAVLFRRSGVADGYMLRRSVSLGLTSRSGFGNGHLNLVIRLIVGAVPLVFIHLHDVYRDDSAITFTFTHALATVVLSWGFLGLPCSYRSCTVK